MKREDYLYGVQQAEIRVSERYSLQMPQVWDMLLRYPHEREENPADDSGGTNDLRPAQLKSD